MRAHIVIDINERLELGPASVEGLPDHVWWVAGAVPRGRHLGNDPRHVDLPVDGLPVLNRGSPLGVPFARSRTR